MGKGGDKNCSKSGGSGSGGSDEVKEVLIDGILYDVSEFKHPVSG